MRTTRPDSTDLRPAQAFCSGASHRTHRSGRTGAETGSAYLIVLLVLVVLSIVGLSLVLVTQIESEIGTNERIIHRTFYSADSGVAAAVARKMSGGAGPFEFQMNSLGVGAWQRGDQVAVDNFFPVRLGFCNLCTANSGSEYHRIDYLVVAESTRYGTGSANRGNRHPLARQAVRSEVSIQPERGPGEFLGLDKRSGRKLGQRLERADGGSSP